MKWKLVYLLEVEKDLKNLNVSQRHLVQKAIKKLKKNPLPIDENGYGKPLGNDLTGFFKIKLQAAGLRIVYKIQRIDNVKLIIVIGVRADEEIYDIERKRAVKQMLLNKI
jgi:mRNA interferase RelE/StbE